MAQQQTWRRLGQLFDPTGQAWWMQSHAALPIPLAIGPGRFRVYVAGRDAQGRGQVGSVDLTMPRGETAAQISNVSKDPVIRLGPLGSFDDAGVTGSCLVKSAGRLYLYYTGWTLGGTVPFLVYAGVAVSDDGGATFQKVSRGPILGRDDVDPFLTGSPFVLIENGLWRMWYISATEWRIEDGKPKHWYHIRYAESSDGVQWRRLGVVAVDYASPDEHAMARPVVIYRNGQYQMWFCARGSAYHLAYAESWDGIRWERNDAAAQIEPTQEEWDKEMLAYPWVFRHDGRDWMLYNGNSYGRTGVGLAVCSDSGSPQM